MDPLEHVMRVMTHVNIGAALGMVAWLTWSGAQVVTGQIVPAPIAAQPDAPPASTARHCRCEPQWPV